MKINFQCHCEERSSRRPAPAVWAGEQSPSWEEIASGWNPVRASGQADIQPSHVCLRPSAGNDTNYEVFNFKNTLGWYYWAIVF
jgi:hypothetical protein